LTPFLTVVAPPEVLRFHLATDQWKAVWDHLDGEFVNDNPSQLLEFMQDGARTGAAQIAGRAVAGVLENLDMPHRQIGWRASSFEGGAVPGTQHLIAPMPSLPDAGDELRPSRQMRPTTVTGTETRIVVSGATQARARTAGLGNGGLRSWLGELALEWQTVDDPFRESRLSGYRSRGLQLESLRECFQLGVENE
jgi:hypothetical protein